MSGRLCQWVCAGALTAGFALGVPAETGYLPTVGPVPLRFRPEPPPATNFVKLPLPLPEEPMAAPVMGPPTNTPPPVKPVVAPPAVMQASSAPTNAAPAPDFSFPNPNQMVSPQMLMKYFNRTTNGTVSGVIAPVDFAPPPASGPPPSTGTYTTSPK